MAGIFWIHGETSPPLAVVLCPQSDRGLRNDLRAFKRGGLQTLVSLLEKQEATNLGLEDEGSLALRVGLQFLSHPLPDHQVPPDEAAFRAFVMGLARRLRAGERIGVHCWGSIGRATVTAACTLIELGWPPKAALCAVGTARCCPVPDTPEQQDWILRYQAQAQTRSSGYAQLDFPLV